MSQRRLFRDEAFARRGRTEPIDGLLRITAPHEWVFLALLAVALIAVLAWALFGTIERGLSASCLVAAPADGGVEAVARLPNEDARRIVVGMAARTDRSTARSLRLPETPRRQTLPALPTTAARVWSWSAWPTAHRPL